MADPASPLDDPLRGVFRSVVDLQVAISHFVAETNADPKPFVWTADPNRVLAAIKRGKQGVRVAPLDGRIFYFFCSKIGVHSKATRWASSI